MLLARQYYAMVLTINPNNAQALIGLKLACNALGNLKSLKSDELKKILELSEFATHNLKGKYESRLSNNKQSSNKASNSISNSAVQATLSAIDSLNVKQK